MTVHPSLSSKTKSKHVRSVLKRYERLKEMLAKEKWKIGDSVFGLPKIKALRWKLKKLKKVETEAEGAEAGTGPATTREKTNQAQENKKTDAAKKK